MNNLSGVLLLDKPKSWTSHDLVHQVRRILKIKEVGHCGTLDPIATGLMVILVGEATKLSNYILDKEKRYYLEGLLGKTTDSLDITGQVLEEKSVLDMNENIILKIINQNIGELELPIPIFSAAKVDGVPLYKKAREGLEISEKLKRMSFFDLKWYGYQDGLFKAEISCTKGSFIRSWIHKIGQDLNVGATMFNLRRLNSWPYSIEKALTIESLERMALEKGQIENHLIPISSALPDFKSVRVSGFDETLILNGQISHGLRSQIISVFKINEDKGIKILSKSTGELRAIIGLEEGKGFVIRRVFRY